MSIVTDEPEVETLSDEQPEAADDKPVAIPQEPPADCPDHVRQHYDQIREKEREVYGLEGEYLAAKERASEAKKDFEAADKALRRLIARGADPQRELPFEKPATARKPKRIKLLKEIKVGLDIVCVAGTEFDAIIDDDGDVSIMAGDKSEENGEPQSTLLMPEEFEVIEWSDPAAAAIENDAWRSAPFAELGLTEKQNELFESAGIATIGQLEDLRAQIAEGKASAQWPKGVGPAKVTDIENRVIDWLDRNRDKFGEVAAVIELLATDAAPAEKSEAQEEPATEIHAKTNGKPKSGKRNGFAGKASKGGARGGKRRAAAMGR